MKPLALKWMAAIVLCVSLASGCAQKAANQPAASAAPANEKAGVTKMQTASIELNKLLDAKKDSDIKKMAATLEDEWASFEDGVKKKFPDLYIAVEKDLSPLTAGSKASPLDYALLKKTNDSLHATLGKLSEAFEGKKEAVNEEKLNADPVLQTAAKSYHGYVEDQGKQLVTLIGLLNDSVAKGDLKTAQMSYVKARMPYERIEPIIEQFSELDGAMDARVDDFENEKDPKFTGFHRIEHFLFVQQTTKGAESFAAGLLADSKKLLEEIGKTQQPPADFLAGVGELMEETQAKKISGEEERWSGATLPVLRGNVEGAQNIFQLVQEELKKKDAALTDKIAKQLQDVFGALDALSPVGDDWVKYDTIAQSKKVELKSKLEGLGDSMSRLSGTLGG